MSVHGCIFLSGSRQARQQAAAVSSRQVTFSSPNSLYPPAGWAARKGAALGCLPCPLWSLPLLWCLRAPCAMVGGQRLRSLPPQGRGRDFFAPCYAWPWRCQLHLHGPKAANMSACCVLAISPHQAVWRVTLGLWMLQGAGFTQPGCVPVLDWWCDPLPTPWRSFGFI